MHELGMAEAALQQTLDFTRRAGAHRVVRVVLRVGELSGVDPDALRFAFTAIMPGTAADGAALEIEAVAAMARCPVCELDFHPGADFLFLCPTCQRLCPTLTHGRELELTRLEVD